MSYLQKQLNCHRGRDSRDSRNSEVNKYYTRIPLPAASTGSEWGRNYYPLLQLPWIKELSLPWRHQSSIKEFRN
jgi:hypothetical protein